MNSSHNIFMNAQSHKDVKDLSPLLLLVESNRAVATMLHETFAAWGYHVWVVDNGQEGLDVVSRHAVDVILLDMHTPVMDGRTMLDELRWAGYHMPVWVMSGGSDIHMLRQLLQEGAQGFLVKPFHSHTLQEACAEIFYRVGRHKKCNADHSSTAMNATRAQQHSS
ncbi:response regulator [Nitrospira sp. M1]